MNIKLIEKLRAIEKVNGDCARDLFASQVHARELDEKNELLNKGCDDLKRKFIILQDEMRECVENKMLMESKVISKLGSHGFKSRERHCEGGIVGPECPYGFGYTMSLPATALKTDL
ncbi:hypothetical protein RHGRI_011293 [Rhododendron griersonianum]|uniref:Uncharacterized protein n=1 Tax=Rhododendron griersonianum TaxID=479676 RepID=A0AAV6KLR1_9ERIC|nr:hypothetical protein RHGRI_011293 [Rhododendron griersonianum]